MTCAYMVFKDAGWDGTTNYTRNNIVAISTKILQRESTLVYAKRA